MSVSTRAISNRNNVNPNHFTPQSKPTFTSKELYNLEQEEREDYQLERLSKPKLPFITIPSLNLKILIDSGASKSIINPDPAYKYFQNIIFLQNFTIKSLSKRFSDDLNIAYPMLKEYGINHKINFHIVNGHDRFDALIGNHDLQILGAKINYENNTLAIGKIVIPFFIELNPQNFVPIKQRITNKNIIPVNIENGPVLIQEIRTDSFVIPESITQSVNGICTISLEQEKPIEVHWHEHLDVQPILNFEEKGNKFIYPTDLDIPTLIRTNHFNSEEMFEIINLCKKIPRNIR
ncbi:hypothetical protein HHI36_013151 [Cryptolaemus montrouzieri]|uniref:Retropepsins domain-containing protein n=1 Tax=Cryptolaemus montrouzieri TaxID=559131 RepID=A0ABD2NGT2_9CUCU